VKGINYYKEMINSDPRLQAAVSWLQSLPLAQPESLAPASADASFRRYFRLVYGEGETTAILMDSPPDREPLGTFLRVQALLLQAGLRAPKTLAEKQVDGFLLLEDFGQTTLLQALEQVGYDAEMAKPFYLAAQQALVQLQKWSLGYGREAVGRLPAYDTQRLLDEMQLFPTWYLEKHLQLSFSDAERAMLARTEALLVERALAQPAVLVHRDYHSRNLMVDPHQPSQAPGVLDFQDAVLGPMSYDLVSLLRDAYVHWPEETQIDWAIRYWQGARAAGLPIADDFAYFYRDFEYMGLQRHLKVLGIFARLSIRDGKHGYLKDIPRVLKDAQHVAGRYIELAPLAALLQRAEGTVHQTVYSF
jgi:aminoglycoside/choline kinase family phosphotransferase